MTRGFPFVWLALFAGCGPVPLRVAHESAPTPVGWRLQSFVKPRTFVPDVRFGRHLAVTESHVFASSPTSSDCGGPEIALSCDRSGVVFRYPLEPSPGDGHPIKARRPVDNGRFGRALAASGDWLWVGASEDSEGRSQAGVIHAVALEGALPVPLEALNPEDPQGFGGFGSLVAVAPPWAAAISDNACPQDSSDCESADKGLLHIFRWSGSTWQLVDEHVVGRVHGAGRRLVMNTETLILGQPPNPNACIDNMDSKGAVTVFRRNGESWTRSGQVVADGGCDGFGASLAMDGGELFVGVPGAGEVRIFDLRALELSDIATVGDGATSGFGLSLAVDDEVLVVGAPYDRGCKTVADPRFYDPLESLNLDCIEGSSRGPGAVYLFERGRLDTPTLLFKGLVAQPSANYGLEVALGLRTLVVSAPNDASLGTGVGQLVLPDGGLSPGVEGSGALYFYARPEL